MFTDTSISAELSLGFKENYDPKLPDFSVNVLTSTFWPFSFTENTGVLPAQLLSICAKFEGFYNSKHNGRKITWLKNMGNVDLKARFDCGTKDLNLSVYAMIVLINAFNFPAKDPITYTKILAVTEIPPGDLKRTLQSLSLGKHRVLTKLVKGKDINDTDTFQFNSSFTSPLSKIKILSITTSSSDNVKDRKMTLEKVSEDRKYLIEATIVRIMKSRKSLQHNNLVSEVIGHLGARFSAEPSMVKKRIEDLIEREFLERDATERTIYHYVA